MLKGIFRAILSFLVVASFLFLVASLLPAADKVRFGIAFRGNPAFEMVHWAAQEKGIWKKYDLEVDWYAFRSAAEQDRALTAGALDEGLANAPDVIPAVARGVPAVIIAQFPSRPEFYVWVLASSKIREPKDLKGARIGLGRTVGTAYSYAVFGLKQAGLSQKDVRFVGVGGVRERVAALKSGVVDAFIVSYNAVAPLVAKGEIRGVLNIIDQLPENWLHGALFVGHKDFLATRPEVAKRMVKAGLEAVTFARSDRAWALEKLKANLGFSREAAELVVDKIYARVPEKVDRQALENVMAFMVEYGLVKKGELPSQERLLFPSEYIGQ